jgi:hypothetical protein
MLKSLHLPIKGGARARVKGFRTFEAGAVFRGFFVSSYVICASDVSVCILSSLVFGDLI